MVFRWLAFCLRKTLFLQCFHFWILQEKWAGLLIQPRGRKWLFSGWNKENNRVKSWCRKRIFLPSSASSHHASLLLLKKFWKKMILAKTNLSPALSFHKKRGSKAKTTRYSPTRSEKMKRTEVKTSSLRALGHFIPNQIFWTLCQEMLNKLRLKPSF